MLLRPRKNKAIEFRRSLNVKIIKSLWERLEAVCAKTRLSKTAVVERGLKKEMDSLDRRYADEP
jgi:hypothetical protein